MNAPALGQRPSGAKAARHVATSARLQSPTPRDAHPTWTTSHYSHINSQYEYSARLFGTGLSRVMCGDGHRGRPRRVDAAGHSGVKRTFGSLQTRHGFSKLSMHVLLVQSSEVRAKRLTWMVQTLGCSLPPPSPRYGPDWLQMSDQDSFSGVVMLRRRSPGLPCGRRRQHRTTASNEHPVARRLRMELIVMETETFSGAHKK